MSEQLYKLQHTPNKLFQYVLEMYFRVSFSAETEEPLSQVLRQPAEARWHIARIYHHPQIIEALSDDPEPNVRKAARLNPYWRLIGQFRPLLKLPDSDKITYIQRESFTSILVFLIYETDLAVLQAAFSNPTVSLQMLLIMRRFLQKRGNLENDRAIILLLNRMIELKKHRLQKYSDINRAKSSDDLPTSLANLVPFLLDEDPYVIKCAVSILEKFDFNDFVGYLDQEALLHNIGPQKFWRVLTVIQQHYYYKNNEFSTDWLRELNDFPEADPLKHFVSHRKIALLESCQQDLSAAQNFFTVVLAHTETDKQVRRHVSEMITLDELLALVTDPAFPLIRALKSLEILKGHPFSSIRSHLKDIAIRLALRMQKRLEDIENTINACLDVIFDFGKVVICEYTPGSLNDLKELEYVYELITYVLNFTGEILQREKITFEEDPGLYKIHYDKINALWKSTIGQYLGRFKELDTIIRERWVAQLPLTDSPSELRRELEASQASLEKEYKSAVGCHLQIPCQQCSFRACAAERYLVQIEFYIGEVLEELKDPSANGQPAKDQPTRAQISEVV